MQLTTVINILITSALVVLGSVLGGHFDKPLHLFWLSILIVYAVIIQFQYNKLCSQELDLKAERDKISAFFLTKSTNSNNVLQCTFYPRNNGAIIVKNRRIVIDVYISSATNLPNAPELKINTNKECKVFINNQQVSTNMYAGKYNFYLRQSLNSSWEDKYFRYSFEIEFERDGDYLFNIEANNGQILTEVSNSLRVVNP